MDIGIRLKNLRVAQDLTQEELANRCELTKGFISQVERDLASPSITTLDDILEALGSSLKEFFAETENKSIVFRKEDFYETEDETLGLQTTWIVPNAQKNTMEPAKMTLMGGGRTKEIVPNGGEFFGYVLSGQIELHYGEEVHTVRRDETFYYKADRSHWVENPWKREAVFVWVSNPPYL